ncbi:MAG: hypothetical protein OXC99_02090 [Chloroflexi bacterium]|nr:hypothetical protein [Chloroflexota bacterium]
MPMKWEQSQTGEMWRWKKNDNTVVIHLNKFNGTYQVSVVRSISSAGMGLSAEGFDSLEEAQEWAALLLRED